MNYCTRCESSYEKPGSCNCFAEKSAPLTPYIPSLPVYPTYPVQPICPWWEYRPYHAPYYTASGDRGALT